MGASSPIPFNFILIPTHKPEQLLENVRSSVARKLPEVRECAAHDAVLSIAGGGPSLEDTWQELDGFIASVNGSLSYLLSKGVVPQMCGVCDPSEHMVDVVEANPDVTYFVASHVHPKVFDKLRDCKVYLWHLHPIDGLDVLLNDLKPEGWLQVPGGCTMGLRWVNLGYLNGFRKFHLHGLDSSFRDKASHAYPDQQDTKERITFDGYQTRVNFLGQVVDFDRLLIEMTNPDVEPIQIKMFGTGLLQDRYRASQKFSDFIWPKSATSGSDYILCDARNIPEFMKLIPRRGVAIQAGGNVGVYPAYLARYFNQVHTFEPDPDNYACLVENTKGMDNITTHHAALGTEMGAVSTVSHEDGVAGADRIIDGGPVEMLTIDDLPLTECDLIWLDVEGYEENALRGAELTVASHHPAIIIEEKGEHALMHGLTADGAQKWLKEREYRRVAKYGNDCLYVYIGK